MFHTYHQCCRSFLLMAVEQYSDDCLPHKPVWWTKISNIRGFFNKLIYFTIVVVHTVRKAMFHGTFLALHYRHYL